MAQRSSSGVLSGVHGGHSPFFRWTMILGSEVQRWTCLTWNKHFPNSCKTNNEHIQQKNKKQMFYFYFHSSVWQYNNCSWFIFFPLHSEDSRATATILERWFCKYLLSCLLTFTSTLCKEQKLTGELKLFTAVQLLCGNSFNRLTFSPSP